MTLLVDRVETLDLSPYGVDHPHPFLLDLRVRTSDLSRVVNHVSNVEYVKWIDSAAERHADALGLTRAALVERGHMWFVARHEINYLAEAHADDHLVVGTWVRDVGRVKSWRDTIIVRPSDGATIIQASTLWVLVDLDRRRPIRIAGALRESLEAVQSPAHVGATSVTPSCRAGGNAPCTSP